MFVISQFLFHCPFSIPYCYLKYHVSIILPASKDLQNHSPLMRGTGTWIHTRSCPSRYHSYISHSSKLPCITLDTKFVQKEFCDCKVVSTVYYNIIFPQLHSSCHRSSDTEKLTESPHRILDSTLLTCISFF